MNYICRLLIFLEITHQAITQASGPEVLVSEPSSGVVKEGEEFKLHCRNSGKVIDVNWFKNNIYLPEIHSEFYESLADSSSGGSYQCDLLSNQWERSKPLEVVTIASDMILTLEVNPTAALSGEQIIFKCLFSDQKMTEFLWYRKEELMQRTDKSQYIIAKAEITDESSYRCECKIDYRKWVSPEVNVTVTDHDVAFQVDPPSVLEGDVLNLNCRYRKYYLWKDVDFYKGIRKIYSMKLNNWKALHSFRVNSSKDSGSYHCTIDDKISRSVDVHVHELFAKPKLRTEPAVEIFEGDQLKLICFVETMRANIGLQYSFYQKGKALNLNADNNYNYIEAASVRDSGTYLCEANVVYRGVKKKSDEVSIEIKDPYSEVTIEVEPENPWVDQSLVLRCKFKYLFKSKLIYTFFREGSDLTVIHSSNKTISFEMERVTLEDAGRYRCEVYFAEHPNGPVYLSRYKTVHIQDPYSELTIEVEPENPWVDQSLVLRCKFNYLLKIKLIYTFFREGSNLTVIHSSNKSISFEMEHVTLEHAGRYRCEVYFAEYPNGPVHLSRYKTVHVQERRVILDVKPETPRDGDTIVLRCVCKESNMCGSGQYGFYRNNSLVNYDSGNSKIYKIQRATEMDSGFYHCTIGSDGVEHPSRPVPVTVKIPASCPSLISDLNSSTVAIGDRVTLRCWSQRGSPPINYLFYRDQHLLANKTVFDSAAGTLTITVQSEDEGGVYYCGAANAIDHVANCSETRTLTVSGVADPAVPIHTTAIRASVLTIFLVAALIALVFVNLPNRKQDNSSIISQPLRFALKEATGNKARPRTEGTAADNYQDTDVGSAQVTDNDGGASGRKPGNRKGPSDYCVPYATVNRAITEVCLEGGPIEESCFYENPPRK